MKGREKFRKRWRREIGTEGGIEKDRAREGDRRMFMDAMRLVHGNASGIVLYLPSSSRMRDGIVELSYG